MCDYCDCRELPPIGALSRDHERIRDLVAVLRRTVAAGDEPAGGAVLVELQDALAPHLVREEAGLLSQLAGLVGFERYLDEIHLDHARARASLLARVPDQPGWSDGLGADLDELVAHIELEEYDLFPASRQLVDAAGWAAIDRALLALDGVANDAPPAR